MMKLKSVISLVLILAITMTAFLLPAYADGTVTGTCGENATYTYANGVLTISGTGSTYGYIVDEEFEEKWGELDASAIKKVVVEEGITRIGSYLFARCTSLKELVLPESVKEIREGGFYCCTALEKANVAEDVICGDYAFTGCDKFHPLKITIQPQDIEVENVNDYALVKVKATGDGVAYQWYYGGQSIGSNHKSTVASGKTDTYKTKVTEARYGRYVRCWISDRYGRRMRTNAVRLTFHDPYPTIVTQPASVSAKAGETAKITVKATGLGLTYTWYYKNANQILFHKSTTTKPSYSIKMTEARDGRQMYCEIRDQFGRKVTTQTVTFSLSR